MRLPPAAASPLRRLGVTQPELWAGASHELLTPTSSGVFETDELVQQLVG